jgi:predicted  nucleic acid-binding Zn-ribbon protein
MMSEVVSLTNINSQKRLSLASKLEEINNELKDLENKEKELCSQRNSLERQLYTPRERAEISIKRKAKKLTW